jgi:hypothetical protein
MYAMMMKSTLVSMQQFSTYMQYLGPTVTPPTPQDPQIARMGKKVGLAQYVLQSKGEADVPNWWGTVLPGDCVGFVAKKWNPMTLGKDVGLDAVKALQPIQIYPIITRNGATFYAAKLGISTVAYEGYDYSNIGDFMDAFTASLPFPLRCVDNESYDPATVDPAYVEHTLVPTHGPDGNKVLYQNREMATGLTFHVGVVAKIIDEAPSVDLIKLAFLGPDEKKSREAKEEIESRHRIMISVTGSKPYGLTSENTLHPTFV